MNDADHDQPDYTSYTLDELCDAQRHIDADQYPDRAQEIEGQIQIRLAEPPRTTETEPSPRLPFELTKRGLGFLMAGLGGFTLVRALDADTTGHVGLVYTLIAVMYGGMILAGVLLILKKRIGVWTGCLVMALHVPLFRIGRIAYTVTVAPVMELKLWPRIGIGFSSGSALNVQWYSESQPLYLGVNCVAFAMAAILASHIARQAAAYRRLVEMRRAG